MFDSQSDMNRNLLNFFVYCALNFTRDREKWEQIFISDSLAGKIIP
jgi:hypothetical protein